MAPKVASESISNTQLEYLADVNKEGSGTDEIGEALLMVCRDKDITLGRETIHPDWSRLFHANAEALEQILHARDYAYLRKILGKPDPFEPELRKLKLSNKRVTFLLGAGASKPSGIPTVKDLLPDLLSRARRLERDDLGRLADFCEKTKIDNIEDLLTAAHLAEYCSHNSNVLRLVEFLLFRGSQVPDRMLRQEGRLRPRDLSGVAFLQDTLEVLFGLLSSRMLPARPNKAHEAIAAFVKTHRSVSIVTTNYDCCMDLALGTEERDFTYHVNFANATVKAPAQSVPLIKLHGSLNWFYCETCQKVHLVNIKETTDDYLGDRKQYSVNAVCRECNGQRRGLVVPPQAMKFDVAPPLTPLLERAQSAFNHADVIVVVGFSFADADIYISRMLTKAVQNSRQMKVVIFDPDATVVSKVRRSLSLRIERFNTARVIPSLGDGAECLPAFLGGKLPPASSSDGHAKKKLRPEK